MRVLVSLGSSSLYASMYLPATWSVPYSACTSSYFTTMLGWWNTLASPCWWGQSRWLSGLRRSRVHSLWLLVDHCVLRNWDLILVRAVKGLISRAGMVSICPLLWQRDVKLQQTNIHGDESSFVPYDLEVSHQELVYIVKKAEQWRCAREGVAKLLCLTMYGRRRAKDS